MAATVYLSETNGPNTAPVVTDNIGNVNFGTWDAPNLVPTAHPIIIGQCSYAKWLRVCLSALGGSTQISNLKIWKSSGDYKVGELVGTNAAFNSLNGLITTYAHKVAFAGGGLVTTPVMDNGQPVLGATGYASYTIPTVLPVSELVYIGGALGGHLDAPGYSDYIFIGLLTTASTPAGPVNQKVFSYQWDEV